MRIVGGQYKGRRIHAPKGETSRPTTDRNRESLFNILSVRDDIDLENARVLDLFAGSGALGFEAISRGASFVLFVETDAAARGAIRDNIEALGAFGTTRLHRRSAASLGTKPASAGDKFNLVFADPPYGEDLAKPALEGLHHGEWLSPNALIIVEQGKKETPVAARHFEEIDRRVYGNTMFGLYRYLATAVL